MTGAEQRSRAVRLVIADDDAAMRELLRASIGLLPAVDIVGEAADGVEAVELTVERNPDAALLDVNMPRVDGFEAAELIGRIRPDTRVLLHTAAMTSEKQFRARTLGVRLVDKMRLEEMLEFASFPPDGPAATPLTRLPDQLESVVLLALAERAGEAVLIVRPDLTVPYYNRAAGALLGLAYPAEPTTVQAVSERLPAAVAGGAVARALTTRRPASEVGATAGRPLRIAAIPFFDPDGEFLGVGAYVQPLDGSPPDPAAGGR